MKKIFSVFFTVIFLAVFGNSANAQERDGMSSPTPPAEKIEPMVMHTDLKAEAPAPPPEYKPVYSLPPHVEKLMKEKELEEHRRIEANTPKKNRPGSITETHNR